MGGFLKFCQSHKLGTTRQPPGSPDKATFNSIHSKSQKKKCPPYWLDVAWNPLDSLQSPPLLSLDSRPEMLKWFRDFLP